MLPAVSLPLCALPGTAAKQRVYARRARHTELPQHGTDVGRLHR